MRVGGQFASILADNWRAELQVRDDFRLASNTPQ
jgi:hypothetical protein